jgi:CheY-like chemotaxis protein
MYILVVEDDKVQADLILSKLRYAFPRDRIEHFRTEHEFQSRIDKVITDPPDVVVMDVMLRWTAPSPNLPEQPDDVRQGGVLRAGFRCKKLLARHDETKNIPVIFYSVLTENDLRNEIQPNDVYLLKDAEKADLVDIICQQIKDIKKADTAGVLSQQSL